MFFGERAHTHMFGQSLSLDIFKDDRVAQAFNMDEIHDLPDIFVVEHGGGFKLPFQRGQACWIVDKFLFQSLDNDFSTIEIGGIDTTVSIAGSMDQSEVGVVV